MYNNFYPNTITIRLPSLIKRLVDAEIAKRNFFKQDGTTNESKFYNKILPNMLDYREYKNSSLRRYLEKNVKESITEGMQEKMLDLLTISFDYLYFDKNEQECNDVINLRIDVSKENIYAELFVRLDNIGVKRSTYLRNLIIEYLFLAEYQKERICFKEEYDKMVYAIKNKIIFEFKSENKTFIAYAVSLEYSVKNEHWYLLFFKENNFKTIYSIPIYKITKILFRYKIEIEPERQIVEKVHEIIDTGEYANAIEFQLEVN